MKEIAVYGFLLGAMIVIVKLIVEMVQKKNWPFFAVLLSWILVLIRSGVLFFFSRADLASERTVKLPAYLDWMGTDLCFEVLAIITMAGAVTFLFRDYYQPHYFIRRKLTASEKETGEVVQEINPIGKNKK